MCMTQADRIVAVLLMRFVTAVLIAQCATIAQSANLGCRSPYEILTH